MPLFHPRCSVVPEFHGPVFCTLAVPKGGHYSRKCHYSVHTLTNVDVGWIFSVNLTSTQHGRLNSPIGAAGIMGLGLPIQK